MSIKIPPAVLEVIEDHDPNTYVRIWCRLSDMTLSTPEREVLEKELFCTHLMFTGFICSLEVPIKFLDRVASFHTITSIEKAVVF